MSDNLRTDNAVPPQAGKVMIVTGATSGIGYETTLALAKADASVVLASRNEAKGNMTLENIRRLRSALCALIPGASPSHKRTLFHFEDLQLKQCYNPMTAYSQSKLAVLTFALELSRRIANNGLVIKVIPVHPGVAATEITRGGDRANPVIRRVAKTMFGVIGQSAARVLGRLSMLQFPVMCKAECITAPMVLENAVEFLHRLKSHLKHQIEKMPQDCG